MKSRLPRHAPAMASNDWYIRMFDFYPHILKIIDFKLTSEPNIYTWKKDREHLLCFEGKLRTKVFLQSKYALTKLFNLSKSVVSKVASA